MPKAKQLLRACHFLQYHYSCSHSCNHNAELASLGIRQSPRGLKETDPTLGPSGKQERLNC